MKHTPHKVNPWIAGAELFSLAVILGALYESEPMIGICGVVIYIAASRMRFTDLLEKHTTYFSHRKRPVRKKDRKESVGIETPLPPGWKKRDV